jgi:hypothetical protein
MKTLVMVWTKPPLLSSPFVLAAVLTVILCDRLHLRPEHIAAYVFLFGAPWDWLLDHDPFGDVQSRWLSNVIAYAFLLRIPALLYPTSLWLLLRVSDFGEVVSRARSTSLEFADTFVIRHSAPERCTII